MSKEYQYTGKSYPVDRQTLIRSVFDALQEYEDNNMDQGQRLNLVNPYEDPVLVRLPDGKIIQVPPEIQNEALRRWGEMDQMSDDLAGEHVDESTQQPVTQQPIAQKIASPMGTQQPAVRQPVDQQVAQQPVVRQPVQMRKKHRNNMTNESSGTCPMNPIMMLLAFGVIVYIVTKK